MKMNVSSRFESNRLCCFRQCSVTFRHDALTPITALRFERRSSNYIRDTQKYFDVFKCARQLIEVPSRMNDVNQSGPVNDGVVIRLNISWHRLARPTYGNRIEDVDLHGEPKGHRNILILSWSAISSLVGDLCRFHNAMSYIDKPYQP